MTRRHAWTRDDGAVAVEFALIFPILFVMLIGIIEFGSVYNAQLMITGAAREAARSMTVGGSVAQAQTAAVDAATGLALPASAVTITPAACTPGTDVSVDIHYDKPMLTQLFGLTIPLEGVATRRCSG